MIANSPSHDQSTTNFLAPCSKICLAYGKNAQEDPADDAAAQREVGGWTIMQSRVVQPQDTTLNRSTPPKNNKQHGRKQENPQRFVCSTTQQGAYKVEFVTRIAALAIRCRCRYLPPSSTLGAQFAEDRHSSVEEAGTLPVPRDTEPSSRGLQRESLDEISACPPRTRPCEAPGTAPPEGTVSPSYPVWGFRLNKTPSRSRSSTPWCGQALIL